jgi:hypothetical protein
VFSRKAFVVFTYIHNVITFTIVKQPIVKQSHFGVGCSNRVCASGEEPTEDGPSGYYFRTEDFVGRVNNSHDEPN